MGALISIIGLFALAYAIVYPLKKKADSVDQKKQMEIRKEQERINRERRKAEKEAEDELKEKIESYKLIYDEDTVMEYVDMYGEDFDQFIDEELENKK